ncbi:TlpA family protein disulfide reductase [Agromyces sp. CCNWLW203]|uniref:TlpA family protein disulfide reductase n=1 Tax=Agromyces sp. CCNWLW203 TaxID=3112842 RepID=UPI002F967483
MSNGRRSIAALGILAGVILVMTACSSGVRGGATQLPAPVPAEVEYAAAAESPMAPSLEGRLVDDTPVDLEVLAAGRPLVVQFMASWCSSCAEQQDVLSRISDEYGDTIAVAHVSGDTDADALTAYLDEHGVDGPVLVDPELQVWRSFAVTEPPMTALIDHEGHLVRLWPAGADEEKLGEQLDRLVRGSD